MDAIYCYSWVEDEISAAAVRRMVEHRNRTAAVPLHFFDGFPHPVGGCYELRKRCAGLLNMARAGLHTITVADLDSTVCPAQLIADWFAPGLARLPLPRESVFRIAVREIEAWLIADAHALARHLGIPVSNFTADPESLADPKTHLLEVIRRKGTRAIHRDMLPRRNARVGPEYNRVLADFASRQWRPLRASAAAPSLRRALDALNRI